MGYLRMPPCHGILLRGVLGEGEQSGDPKADCRCPLTGQCHVVEPHKSRHWRLAAKSSETSGKDITPLSPRLH